MAGFALMFSRKFDDLSKYPPALGSMLIIIVAAVPGKPVGRCLAGCFTAVAGFLVGGAFFAITARLGAYPVAQAFVFAFMVYGKPVIHFCSLGNSDCCCHAHLPPSPVAIYQ